MDNKLYCRCEPASPSTGKTCIEFPLRRLAKLPQFSKWCAILPFLAREHNVMVSFHLACVQKRCVLQNSRSFKVLLLMKENEFCGYIHRSTFCLLLLARIVDYFNILKCTLTPQP